MRLVYRGLRADIALSGMLSWWLGWGLGGGGFETDRGDHDEEGYERMFKDRFVTGIIDREISMNYCSRSRECCTLLQVCG